MKQTQKDTINERLEGCITHAFLAAKNAMNRNAIPCEYEDGKIVLLRELTKREEDITTGVISALKEVKHLQQEGTE